MENKAYNYRIEVPCRTLSPFFMHGALKNKFELRPSEFIFGMRQWIRRFNVGVSPDQVFEFESRILGKGGEGLQAAEVSVDLELFTSLNFNAPKGGKLINFFENEVTDQPTYNRNTREYMGEQYGVAYLFYTKNLGENKQDEYVLPGYEVADNPDVSDFQIELQSDNLRSLEVAMASLIALSIFSGVGSRSRRGAGCFEIDFDRIKCDGFQSTQLGIANDGWSIYILPDVSDNIQLLANIMNQINTRLSQGLHIQSAATTYQSWYKNTMFTIVDGDFAHWFDCLNEVGKIMAEYRLDLAPEDNVLFGLPNKKFKVSGDNNFRRASPLVITLVCAGDLMIPILYELNEPFLPARTTVRGFNAPITPKPSAIMDFLTENFDSIL